MPLESLAGLNTLGVAASADRLAVATSEAALRRIVLEAGAAGQPLMVLGGGSNVVLRRRYRGTVCLMRLRGLHVEPRGPEQFAVTAMAGESWHGLVRFCLGRGLYGLENLALIPGSVGAAPLQNIGAYGVELADHFVSLRAMDVTSGRMLELDAPACRFGYRDSLFKSVERNRFVVVAVTLLLTTRPRPVVGYPDVQLELRRMGRTGDSPAQVAEAVIRVRRRKLPDPRRIGNVGSFFKNPVVPADLAERLRGQLEDLVTHPVDASGRQLKLSAAQLIDRAGWKGKRRGCVGVWPRQPLVLVNLGGASGADFLQLSADIRADVLERFGVELELEPGVFGED